MHAADPASQVLSIADRRGKADELNMRRRTNNGLFPDGAATNIAQVVEFIKNDETYIGQ